MDHQFLKIKKKGNAAFEMLRRLTVTVIKNHKSYVKTSSDAGGGAFGKSQGLQCAPAYGGAGLKYYNTEVMFLFHLSD